MSSSQLVGTVRIRCTCTSLLKENAERVLVLFAARLQEKSQNKPGESAGVPQETTADDDFVEFGVYTTGPPERVQNTDLIPRLQKYVDDICGEGCAGAVAGGEDSSYDSDYEIDPPSSSNSARPHQDVSRTTSDTLAAEYADYVQTNPQIATADATPGYTARVEFALKLGYTEKLVQAALHKLGPSPAQNELLAELIKLGAQKGGGSSCDTSPSEGALDVPELIAQHQQQLQQQQTINEQQLSILGGHALLRPIVIDGSNVAMSHGNKEVFSCRGIKLCVDWFKSRGHKEITVFVPKWRKEQPRADNPIKDQEVLAELEKERLLVFTPSRLVGGKRMVCYDDRYVLKLAAEVDGIVVSNDNYRDLCQESTEFRKVVEERILMYSFVNDRFMPPDDPLGRSGPTLDNFLRIQPPLGLKKGPLCATLSSSPSSSSATIGGGLGADAPPPPPLCPYGKKCTYGNKCKYHHPERGPYPHKSVTERLSEHAQRHLLARTGDGAAAVASATAGDGVRKTPLGRTRSNIPPPKENQHAIVSKSRSVDNVGGCTTLYQPLQPLQQQQQGVSVGENLHRKLQRQLTLNPTSDPRLIRRYVNQQQQQNSQQQQQQQQAATAPPQQQYMAAPPGSWDLHHQHVTRIASAPESYHPWPPNTAAAVVSQQQQQQHTMRHMQRMSSCSDPQLNVWPPPSLWGPSGASALSHTPTPSQQQQPPLTKNNNHSSSNNNNSLQHEDARRKLHYHLAAIFPEEQVTQAMQMYPDETNPQKICAAILSMFPNKT